MRIAVLITALASLASVGLGAAHAAPVVSGSTVVDVTADLGALGLSAEPLDDSTIADGRFTFPISGGALDGLAGTIEHEEAGVRLFTATDSVTLENFVIDTVASEIIADVTVNDSAAITAAVFSFDLGALGSIDDLFDLANPSLPLVFTSAAASVLADAFGLTIDLTGVEFGLAATSPELVPVPGAIGLFAIGAAFLGWARRRKAAA
ncbi:MAG: PEP-CTERM sorting domain-containing protein [Pseudomonadota bacterium]